MKRALVEHYRFPPELIRFQASGDLSKGSGYFRLGEHTICYGRSSSSVVSQPHAGMGDDALQFIRIDDRQCLLPFDPTELVENLRREHYAEAGKVAPSNVQHHKRLRTIYYKARPMLPVVLRRYLQKFALRKWGKIRFPKWPVDRTVESIFEKTIYAALMARNFEPLPFIWFWPQGKRASLVMTHDVETEVGRDFCGELMDMDDSAGLKASFQLIPEGRYALSPAFLNSIRNRGFEINVHDLNHDGRLFESREVFLARSKRIDRYVAEFRAQGFRSGALYRNIDWIQDLDIQYDMSVPNIAQLEPQQGGCCTVTPYFVGSILELPLTTVQDYGLLHIIGDYSIDLWTRQLSLILEKHGMVSFLIHPDYIRAKRARRVYLELLSYLKQLQGTGKIWLALPSEVNEWWRQRSQMNLRFTEGKWRIEGSGSERARVAHARVIDGEVRFEVEGDSPV